MTFALLLAFMALQPETGLTLARLTEPDFTLFRQAGCHGNFRQGNVTFLTTSTDQMLLRADGRRIVLNIAPKLGQGSTDPRDEDFGEFRIRSMPHLTEARPAGARRGPVYRVSMQAIGASTDDFAGRRETPARVSITAGARSTSMDGIWSFHCQ